jgi:thiamine biosynthesis lipoprotein ApbE
MRSAASSLAFLVSAIVYAQSATDAQGKWTNSFDDFKANIRVLDKPAKQVCEDNLRKILKSLDAVESCSVDSECTLLNQDPFGSTVPVHVDRAKAVLARMKQFAGSCDNHALRSVQNNGTVSVPACVKNRCVVLTSLAHQQ